MRVKKFRSINIYEIGKTESYLSDMAKEGLLLKGMSQSFNYFEINAPADREYRLEFGEKVLSREMRDMYKVSGWRYVCSFKGIHIFQASASDNLVEIHTDPEEQSYTLRKSCKLFKRLILFEIIMLLFMMAFAAFGVMIGDTPALNLLETNFIHIISVAIVIYTIFEITRQLQALIQIKKRLQLGFYINHHEPWKKRSVGKFIVYSLLAVVLIICFASITSNIVTIAGAISGRANYALTLSTELPVVRLNDIEKLEMPVIRSTYYSEVRNYPVSHVSEKYNVFMKEYEINEEFVQEDMTYEGEPYTPSIRTNYYKIYAPFMVQGALSDVLHKAESYFLGLPDESMSVEKIECNGLDEVYYIPSGYNEEHYFGLVVRKGNVIIWMIYNGQKSRTDVIQASQELFK